MCTLTVNMKMINIRNDQQSRILDNVRQNDPVIRKQDEVTRVCGDVNSDIVLAERVRYDI